MVVFGGVQADKESISIRNSTSFRGYQCIGENVTKVPESPTVPGVACLAHLEASWFPSQGRADAHEAVDFFSESERARREGNGPTNFGRNQWPNERSGLGTNQRVEHALRRKRHAT
jgi:hypothetical protein